MSKYIFNNDAEILEFLEQLREKSIQIWAEGEKIRYRSKNGQLAPEILGTLKMAKGQILDFLRMVEKNVIPLTAIQTAYVVGQTAGCELGNVNAHYYIEYTIESLNVERLEQMINLVISKNDVLRLIVTHEGKASFLDNVPYYSVPIYSLYDENVREQKRLERSHHRYNYYKWPMFHFCVGKTSGKTSVLHIDFDCIILDAWSAKLLLDEIFSLYYGEDVKFPRIRQQYPQVKTELLNLDDWDPSKFGEFHVIIAAGVLNNTKNILETVNKLKHMLRDEGILLVTEPLEEHIEITVSQAFMMPKHSDVRCMTGHCFLTEEEWIQSFDEVGLETVRIFPDEQNKYAQFKQKLFIVRKKQIVYREFLKSILPTVMIPTEFVNVDNIPLSLNGKVDRKALVRNFKRKLSSKDSIIIDQQNSKKQIYTEVEKKMIEIMRIVSGNSNISYEDNLLENGFDSLLLSQASGKIVNEIPEASGLRFDEILRVALVTPMIKMISEYIERKNSESKQKEKVESNDVPVPTSATHNVMYILGSDKGKWKEALEKTMLDSDILVKETEKEKLKTEVKSDAIANKYLLICKDNISEILAEVSELLAQEIIIQKVFLLNPEDAKNNDLYLGDVIVINGAPSVIDSWKEAVLGDMKAYVGSFAETCNIIKVSA